MGSGNPRSILLPVSLKDMKEVRAIKIINATQARNLKGFKINQANIINKPVQVSDYAQRNVISELLRRIVLKRVIFESSSIIAVVILLTYVIVNITRPSVVFFLMIMSLHATC